jgi:hypothetical protein
MPVGAGRGDFGRDYRADEVAPPPTARGCGCSVTGVPFGGGARQQLQVQGGQAWPGAQAGQAQPQPALPEPPLPASTGGTGFSWEQAPVGQGAAMHSMAREVQPHASAVSALQEATSVCAVQGSAGGGVPQSQGAQAAPAGQAGHVQTATVGDAVGPVVPLTVPVPDVPVPAEGVVVVVVAPSLQAQLQAGQSAPTGQSGQLQVQVPVPLPPPVTSPPQPPAPPLPPVPPPPPAPPVPQLQSQGGQASPGRQAGQPQVHVPPPPEPAPASTGLGGGQSHWTGGQAPLAGQASGWTHRQVWPDDETRSKQKPPPLQS